MQRHRACCKTGRMTLVVSHHTSHVSRISHNTILRETYHADLHALLVFVHTTYQMCGCFMHECMYAYVIMARTCGTAVRRVVFWAAISVDVMKYETIVVAVFQKECGCIQECASVEVQLRCLLDNKKACICEQQSWQFAQSDFVESAIITWSDVQVRASRSQILGYQP